MDDVSEAAQQVSGEIANWTEAFKEFFAEIFTIKNLFNAVGALFVLLLFWVIYKAVRHIIVRLPETKMRQSTRAIIERILRYAFYTVCVMHVLAFFGVKLTAIWGAAGVAGVAIGFAAQTSVSNIISGLFVLSEKSLKIGDLITVGDVTGIVDEVHLLSVQIHTLDNQMVRIPNSNIINTNLINTTYHPHRRMTFTVEVDYGTDLRRALDVLLTAPAQCPTVLSDPAPVVWINGWNDSGVEMVLAVWFNGADFFATKNDTFIAINNVMNKAGIVIPFERLNVCVVNDDGSQAFPPSSAVAAAK